MVQYASRMNELKGSEIRELLKLTARPDIISFGGGLPAPELFPVEEMKAAAMNSEVDLRGMDAVHLYDETPGAVLLFRVKDRSPAEIATHLDRAGICVRAGLHCAPMAHKALGTGEDGAIRVSFSAMNTEEDIRLFTDALYHIIG